MPTSESRIAKTEDVTVITYPADELNPPDDYSERLEWIRQSYDRFWEHVQKREEVLDGNTSR